jgi:hypothetical protein
MKKRLVYIFASICTAAVISGCGSEQNVSYKSDIKPILDQHCAECHLKGGTGAEATQFLIDSYDNIMKGTRFGPVIVAGDSLSSSLYRLVSGKVDKSIQMPHSKGPMTAQEITAIEKWIDQGALNN